MALDGTSGIETPWGLRLFIAGMAFFVILSVVMVAKAIYEEGIFEAKCTAKGGIVTMARRVCVKIDGVIPIKDE